MNNPEQGKLISKAGVFVCLFVFSLFGIPSARSQFWKFDPQVQRAYDYTLNLQVEEALKLIPDPRSAQELYVVSLAEALDLILTEDGEKYEDYHDAYERKLEKRTRTATPDNLFVQAELRLQWAFIYLKFGHEFDAAWNFRQAYLIVSDCKDRYPGFIPIRKTNAVLEILIGSVPERYQWILGFLGMDGSVSKGLDDLETVRRSGISLQPEADILFALINGFVFQDPDLAVSIVDDMLVGSPDNRLLNFLGGSLAIKASKSNKALSMLERVDQTAEGIPVHFVQYLKGEVFLHQADYKKAIALYQMFLRNYKGQHYIKDANYKIGICHYLAGEKEAAVEYFRIARRTGREDTEADKYAARSLTEKRLPNAELERVRYFTDGGYYSQASSALDSIDPGHLTLKQDRAEYYYRSARLSHKTGDIDAAKKNYFETIRACGQEPWYFAPNACLQLGYIAVGEGDTAAARDYFTRAREYPKHAYKDSIDSKAKSALAQLKTFK